VVRLPATGPAGTVTPRLPTPIGPQPAVSTTGPISDPAPPAPSAARIDPAPEFTPTPSVDAMTPSAPPIAGPLGDRTVTGFVWLLLQTVVLKLVGLVGQIVLAWFLVPDEFGVVTKALTVAAFVNIVQEGGLHQVLVHRAKEFDRWANPAFWLSLATGVVGVAVMLVAAPLAARAYHAPELVGLIALLAVRLVPAAVGMVPIARLVADMRFHTIGLIHVASALLSIGLSVLLAWRGWGPMAIVVPIVVVTFVRAGWPWLVATPRVTWRPEVGRWWLLMADTKYAMGSMFFAVLLAQGDFAVIGLLESDRDLGIYSNAFNLSAQAIALFAANLAGVLFPALSLLRDEPARQTQALLRATRVLAMAGVPACLLQAVLAGPLVRLVFPERWHAVIPVLAVLSLGMAVRIISAPVGNLIQAQGRFRAYMVLSVVYAVAYVGAVAIGAAAGDIVTVAWAATVCFLIAEPLYLYVAIRPAGGRWSEVAGVFAPPIAAGAAAAAAAWAVASVPGMVMQPGRARDAVAVLVALPVATAVYVPLARWTMPAAWGEAAATVRSLLARITGRARPTDAPGAAAA
jgi:O-antigen/teichoic acid export membrane protein